MKILFISTSIPPCEDMQTTRNIYLIKSLLEEGHSVDVLTCGEYVSGQSSFDNVLERINVFRTDYPSVLKWHKTAQKIFKNTPLLKVHNVLVNYYASPDLYAGWNKLAQKKINQRTFGEYDICITSSGSYTAHIIGSNWKRKYHGKWIGEYGDPWGIDSNGNVNSKYYSKERKLIEMCDGIVFTTPTTVKAYKNNYDIDIPYCLVPCGYDKIIEDAEEVRRDGLLFTYTGVAYKKARNLSFFLMAAKERENTKVKIIGSYSDDYKAEFSGNNIEFTGRVKYDESLRMLSESNVLVHIGNFGKLQVPGKTYIYLSTKKPILYIQQEENDDPTYQVLSEFGGIVYTKNCLDDINEAMDYITQNYSELKKDAIERTQKSDIEKYNWHNLGKRFTNFITTC